MGKKNMTQPQSIKPSKVLLDSTLSDVKNAVVQDTNHASNDSPTASSKLGEEDTVDSRVSELGDGGSTSICEFGPQAAEKMFGKMSEITFKHKRKQSRRERGQFADNRCPSEGIQLKKVEIPANGRIQLKEEDCTDLEKTWGYAVVGYFASDSPGKEAEFPGKKDVIRLCKRWNVKYTYYPPANGWLMIKLESQADREAVLSGGPYYVCGLQLLLKSRPAFFTFSNDKDMSSWK